MYPLQEQFKSDALAQLNSRVLQAGKIAGNLLEISHQIGVLNVRTGKASAEALTGAVQKLLAANNPFEFLQLAATVMQPVPQVWTDYAAQLRGIAGKMVTPVTGNLAQAATEALPAPSVVPDVVPDLQGAVPPAALDAAVPEPVLPVEALVPTEAEAEVQPEAQARSVATAPSRAEAAPDVPQAVQEVTEAINNVAKAAPVISAAASPDAKTLARSTVVPKAAVKASRAQTMQKNVQSGKAAGRARKS